MGLQYRTTTCTLTGLTISVTEPSPPRMLSSGQTLELLEPMSLRPLGKRVEEPARCRNRGFRVRLAFLLTGMLASMAVLWGCSGVVSGKPAITPPPPPPPQTYSISGTVTPLAGGSGATVTLAGATSATQTADSSGNYTFTGLASGAYTVTPSHVGYTFSPNSLGATINGANVTGINFAARAQTFSISGTISPTVGGSGATVALSGAASGSTISDSSGSYSFSGLANGTYAITPNHTGYTFSPGTQAATVNGANISGINFSATVQTGSTYSISGTISPTAGGSGAMVALSGAASGSTIADGSGNYTFAALANGTYTVTPTNTGYTFSPVNGSATVNGANVTSVNFTASPQVTHTVGLSWIASTSVVAGYNVYRSTVSGQSYTRMNGSFVGGLSYLDSSVQNGLTYYYVTTAVDSSGIESVYSNEVSAKIP